MDIVMMLLYTLGSLCLRVEFALRPLKVGTPSVVVMKPELLLEDCIPASSPLCIYDNSNLYECTLVL